MASETNISSRASAKKKTDRTVFVGRPEYGRTMKASELDELKRLREGTVDETGMRNIEYIRGDAPSDHSAIANYRRLGYEMVDEGWRVVFKISQEEFLKRQADAQAAYHAQRSAARGSKSHEFYMDETKAEAPVRSDALGDGIPLRKSENMSATDLMEMVINQE